MRQMAERLVPFVSQASAILTPTTGFIVSFGSVSSSLQLRCYSKPQRGVERQVEKPLCNLAEPYKGASLYVSRLNVVYLQCSRGSLPTDQWHVRAVDRRQSAGTRLSPAESNLHRQFLRSLINFKPPHMNRKKNWSERSKEAINPRGEKILGELVVDPASRPPQ